MSRATVAAVLKRIGIKDDKLIGEEAHEAVGPLQSCLRMLRRANCKASATCRCDSRSCSRWP